MDTEGKQCLGGRACRERKPQDGKASLIPYRHPERSRGIFVLASSAPALLIRLHETPYPTFMEYQASRFRSHTHTLFYRERKRFLAVARNDGTGKRYSLFSSFPTRGMLWCRDTALPPSYGRRCPKGAEVGSRSGIKKNG